jgi:hypothetical protein
VETNYRYRAQACCLDCAASIHMGESSSSWSTTWDLHDRRDNGCQDDGLTLVKHSVRGGDRSTAPLARSRLNLEVGHCAAEQFESSAGRDRMRMDCVRTAVEASHEI